MSSTFQKIVFKDLVIRIEDPKLATALGVLDRNRDSIIEIDDFLACLRAECQEPAEKKMIEALADVFDQNGAFKYSGGKEGFKKLLPLYTQVKRFAERMGEWREYNVDTWGGEMEFNNYYWGRFVKHFIEKGGEYAPEKLTEMTHDLAQTILLLSGAPVTNISEKWPKAHVTIATNNEKRWIYNQCAISSDLRAVLQELINYYGSLQWLVRHYREIECGGKGCPFSGEEISLKQVKALRNIQAGANNTLIVQRQSGGGSGGCFTGDTFVKLASSAVPTTIEMPTVMNRGMGIKMSEMVAIQERNFTTNNFLLPSIWSYNECDGEERVQQPTAVVVHPMIQSSLMMLHLSDQKGESLILQVTPDHPLLALQNGGERWVKAGELKNGDQLKEIGGNNLKVDLSKTVTIQGAFNLYNLSFTTEDGDRSPTYLVSPNGKHWIIAHNVK